MSDKKRKWFQKGAFEDGYQFGDITKTILGTATDATQEIGEGALEMVEKAYDAGAYVTGLFGNKKYKQKVSDFIAKDTLNSEKLIKKQSAFIPMLLRAMGTDEEESSILGDKSEELANSAGQLASQVGLQAVGVPWWVTTGVTSFGGGVEEALNENATYGQSGLYGAVQAGSEILSEKLFGGSGLGEKGIFNLDKLTGGIANKTVKRLLDFGIDITANGLEEDVALFFTDLGSALYKEEKLKDILWNENKLDEYIDSFIGGTILGGGTNLGKVSKSIRNKTDYRTGLTANEESVFNKAYEGKIVEAENGGQRLTRKQKAVIYDNTLQQVKSGNVDTKTIESALGGEDYSTYRKTLGNYNALQQELGELQSLDNKVKTQEQAAKEVEIKQRLEQTKIKANKLKNILQNRVAEKIDVDNIRLKDRESYIWDSYIGKLQNTANDSFVKTEIPQNIDENAVVEGMWEDLPNNSKNNKIDNVEKSQLETFDNNNDAWYNKSDIITDGSHLVNGKLKPNVKYKSGEYDYIYATDKLGRIIDLHTDELQYTERDERLKHNANSPGKEIGDHAGHLIGDRYGGSPEIDNIVSQSGLVNLSEYKKIENTWARALDSGQKVGVDIKVQYEGDSMRPSSFIVNYTIDGIKTQTTIEN